VTLRDYFERVDTLTVKLPPQVHRRLAARAKKLNQKKSRLVRDLIERALDGGAESCHGLMHAGCGHYAGSRDASVKEGFGD
jgi:predicted transcriptional regulator